MEEETVEEKTVTTTTPGKGEGKDAFAAARAAVAAQSKDQGAAAPDESPDDDTSAQNEPAQETETPADESTETGPTEDTSEPDTLLTPEETAKLSAKEQRLYEKAQKNYTLKTQRLAEERKALEPWKQLSESLQADPDAVITELARRRGLTIAKTQNTTVQDTAKTTLAELPAELQFLAPVLEQFGNRLLEKVKADIAPIRTTQEEQIAATVAAETDAEVKAFSADPRFKDWKQHEAKMLDIGKKFTPSNGMTTFEYMETLYTLATANRKKADVVKDTVEKINKSAAASESVTPGVQNKVVEHALPPPEKRGMRDAWEAAKRGERWVK